MRINSLIGFLILVFVSSCGKQPIKKEVKRNSKFPTMADIVKGMPSEYVDEYSNDLSYQAGPESNVTVNRYENSRTIHVTQTTPTSDSELRIKDSGVFMLVVENITGDKSLIDKLPKIKRFPFEFSGFTVMDYKTKVLKGSRFYQTVELRIENFSPVIE